MHRVAVFALVLLVVCSGVAMPVAMGQHTSLQTDGPAESGLQDVTPVSDSATESSDRPSSTGTLSPEPSPSIVDPVGDPTRTQSDRETNPETQDTLGYVEGIWYDDELPVDDREDAVVEDDELDDVVHRSMARVEVIRELPFDHAVNVTVISREEFQEESGETFADLSAEERYVENVRLEALFKVDRETDAVDELEALYGGAVVGYYQSSTEQVILVSEQPETPELNEITLGHELLHALQDQHFGLDGFDRETQDQTAATNGLIEGDAVWVEREYEDRCAEEWTCIRPASDSHSSGTQLNTGILLAVLHPYIDGPEYVDYLLETGGWEAVNAAYDDPPTSSSEVIRPGEERDVESIEFEDTSNDEWEPIDPEGSPPSDVIGEAGIAAKFMHQTLEYGEGSVISSDEIGGTFSPYEYDHTVTDGWAGDRFVAYTADEDLENYDDSGFVWKTAWTSPTQAEQFLDGYLTVLAHHGGVAVDGYQNTFVIADGGYPGAYYVEQDDNRVTIVGGPTVDALPAIADGSAPAGEDTISHDVELANETVADADDRQDEPIPGFGLIGAGLVLVTLLVVIVSGRDRFERRS